MSLKLVGEEKSKPWKIQGTPDIRYEVSTQAHIQNTNLECLSNWQYIYLTFIDNICTHSEGYCPSID